MERRWQGELVPAMSGRAWRLSEGSLLRVVDHEGGQTGDVFVVAADDVTDGLSNGRTFDYGETIRLTTGAVLYSRRSRPLLRIVDDEVGTHDTFLAERDVLVSVTACPAAKTNGGAAKPLLVEIGTAG